MIDYDPKTSLRHYPTPMGRFGQNEFGENLYRIVFTESRRHLVGGAWQTKCSSCAGCGCPVCHGKGATEAERGYKWRPKYAAVKTPWILERWYDAFSYTKMTRTKWDAEMVDPISGWLLFGPYPSRGEYDLIWEFDQGAGEDNLENIIAASEFGRSRSFGEVREFHAKEYATEEKDTSRNRFDSIRDSMTAFGGAAISAGRFGRGTKTNREILTANQLGLPVAAGKYRDVGGGYGGRTNFGIGG